MGNAMLCVNDRTHVSKCVHWNESINQPVPSGETLLTIASQTCNSELAQRLINQGANVNQANQNGSMPLHVAIRSRSEDVVNILLDSGADTNARDRSGLTPLHLACVTRSKEILKRLLKCGSNPEGVMDGKFYVSTPLMAATENGDRHLAEILLRHGADVNKRDWWQSTALLKAVQVGSIELVELLLRSGADPNVENRFGGSALHYATIANHCQITRMLVTKGCPVNPVVPRHTSDGRGKETIVKHSLLAASIHRDCVDCFRFFLRNGAEVNGEDMKRKTPLIYAVTNRAWDCNNNHHRPVPQCLHSDNPMSVDSTRIRFAMELIDRGAKLRPVWECVIWQMRNLYVNSADRDAILLCVRAMGFIHREDFKVETFYRTMALSRQWDALWLLYLAGFDLTEECLAIALNMAKMIRQTVDSGVPPDDSSLMPDVWMPGLLHRPRTLKNLCVVKIRECLPDNVIYHCQRMNLPKPLKLMITLDVSPI